MTDDDIKKLGLKLIEKNFQSTQAIFKYKKVYEEHKELFELGQKLLDPDTRSATIYKESLKFMLKKAGSLIGKSLTKSPYYVLNQKGLEALFEAVTAMDTINNARKLVSDAEADLEKLAPKVKEFQSECYDKHKEFYEGIKQTLNRPGVEWAKYIDRLHWDLREETRADAEAEVENALQIAEMLLKDIRPIVDQIFIYGPVVYGNYAALTAAGAKIVLAEKTAQAKVGKLASSSSTISHGFGVIEQARQQTERDLRGLYNEKSQGKSLAARVDALFDDVHTYTMRDWNNIIAWCFTDQVLTFGAMGGVSTMPWNAKMPEK